MTVFSGLSNYWGHDLGNILPSHVDHVVCTLLQLLPLMLGRGRQFSRLPLRQLPIKVGPALLDASLEETSDAGKGRIEEGSCPNDGLLEVVWVVNRLCLNGRVMLFHHGSDFRDLHGSVQIIEFGHRCDELV